jgi:hypothetical protein
MRFISEETFIDDILNYVRMKQYKSHILLFFCAVLLKIYDNIIDWKLNVSEYQKELIKFSLIILPTIAFLVDLNAIYGTFFLHLFSYFDNPHGLDTVFFQVGMSFVVLVSIINFLYNQITFKNFMEMIFVSFIGYMEANLFEEEFSTLKIFVRLLVIMGLFCITFLHFSNNLVVFSKNVIQLMICGIGYLGIDLIMIVYIFRRDLINMF